MHRIFRISILAFTAFSGCSRSSNNQSLAIFVSGDTAGWITPCGCAANQSGGLARRATLIDHAGTPDRTLYLDAGGSASGTNEYHQVKLAAILRGMKAMALAAHNIGGPEAEFAPEQLAALAKATDVTWVSANLEATGGTTPTAKRLVFERNGTRIAVTGVLDPKQVNNSEWTARDPIAAILDALGNVQADIRIVLAYCDKDQLRKLAQSLPEVDFIVGGPTGQALSPTSIGPVMILSATNKGKFLADIRLARDNGKTRTVSVGPAEVKSTLAEDLSQLQNLKQYYAALGKRDFRVDEAGLVAHQQITGQQIAGSASCAKCHAQDDIVWHSSKHSHAWEVLKAKGAFVDPYCQQCHTTGYGYDGGFISVAVTPNLVHVGCENCHGPSALHVANPKRKTPFAAREQCIRCHDHENSPEFNYDAYWPKIRHGQQKGVLPTGDSGLQ